MSIKRVVFIAVAVLAVGIVGVHARFSGSTAAWPLTPGTMSGEVTVSAENNEQILFCRQRLRKQFVLFVTNSVRRHTSHTVQESHTTCSLVNIFHPNIQLPL